MKKILILTLLFSSFLLSASLSSKEITTMISKIKEERVGIALTKLESTVNPFILLVPKKEENLTKESVVTPIFTPVIVEPVYILEAVLNNSAFINKKWYKKGQKLDNYRVTYISKKSVTLKNSDGHKILSLKKKKFIKLH